MSGVVKLELAETVETLKQILSQQKTAKTRERVQVLYWLKTRQAESVEQLACLAGRHRTTISHWLSAYRRGGIEELLNISTSPGRTPDVPQPIRERLQQELRDEQGFESYLEVQRWLKAVCDVDTSYTVVHKLVRYRLKGKLKVPRPVNINQQPQAVETFKKTGRAIESTDTTASTAS